MERDFKGVWIPKEIWLNEELGWTEKLLLVEIDSLQKNGECFATNEYFANFLGLSKDRISKLISNLKNMGYIEVKLIYKPNTKQIEKRIITTIGYRRKQLEGIGENNEGGIGENNEDINTNNINTNNNINININNGEEKQNFADLSPEFLNQKIDNLSESVEVKKLIKQIFFVNRPRRNLSVSGECVWLFVKKLNELSQGNEDKKISLLEKAVLRGYGDLSETIQSTNKRKNTTYTQNKKQKETNSDKEWNKFMEEIQSEEINVDVISEKTAYEELPF